MSGGVNETKIYINIHVSLSWYQNLLHRRQIDDGRIHESSAKGGRVAKIDF